MMDFVLSWALLYFALTGAQYAKYLRYLLPLSPFLFITTSALVLSHASGITRHVLRFAFYTSLLSRIRLFAGICSDVLARTSLAEISRWIYANIPANATLAIEHWDDTLPEPIRNAAGERAPNEYRTLVLPMYDADDAAKLDVIVDTLSTKRLCGSCDTTLVIDDYAFAATLSNVVAILSLVVRRRVGF